MACSSKPSVPLILLITLLAIAQQVTVLAARPTPTTNPNEKQTQSSTPPKKTQADEAHPTKKQHQTQAKPSGSSSLDKKDTECFDQEGTVVIPGIGRYMIGSHPQVPTVGGTFTGDSVPASMNPRYVPGNDDTFVPNPGYEVPNPFRGSVP